MKYHKKFKRGRKKNHKLLIICTNYFKKCRILFRNEIIFSLPKLHYFILPKAVEIYSSNNIKRKDLIAYLFELIKLRDYLTDFKNSFAVGKLHSLG